MNTAIHDGFDLGWKLAWVLRGWTGDGLLDSYEPERRPVAEHNVARSADPERLRARGRTGHCAPTSAIASPTSGCGRRAGASRRSTCWAPG